MITNFKDFENYNYHIGDCIKFIKEYENYPIDTIGLVENLKFHSGLASDDLKVTIVIIIDGVKNIFYDVTDIVYNFIKIDETNSECKKIKTIKKFKI